MTYRRKPKVFAVSFEEPHPLAGLHLQTHPLNVAEFAEFGLKLAGVAAVERAGSDADQIKQLEHLIGSLADVQALFAEKLISWDIEQEDGTPIPATLAGVQQLDDPEFFGIVNEWLEAVGGVDADLGKGSGSGGTTLELSALMEPLSPSLAS